mmetsp:Transcript_11501/g.20786  ORF Transcript_11501/g.20786 Transcript_11501/m.20786 type:complete len:127 (+) Transcript_11501:24-404(+)
MERKGYLGVRKYEDYVVRGNDRNVSCKRRRKLLDVNKNVLQKKQKRVRFELIEGRNNEQGESFHHDAHCDPVLINGDELPQLKDLCHAKRYSFLDLHLTATGLFVKHKCKFDFDSYYYECEFSVDT